MRIVADRKLRGIGRDPMIVVKTSRKAGIDLYRRASANRNVLEVAVAIEQEFFAIPSPVGRFETPSIKIGHAPVCRIDIDRLQRAVKYCLARRSRRRRKADI